MALVWAVLLAAGLEGASQSPDVAVAARSVRPGELVVLTLTEPADIDTVHVRVSDRDVPVFPAGAHTWRALVGIDLATPPGRYPMSIEGGAEGRAIRRRYELHVLPRTFATRQLRVDQAFVNPPADAQERIDREAADLRRLWSSITPARLWSEHFVRPVPGLVTSRFGSRSVFNGVPRPPHGGTDFSSPASTPVHAPAGGRAVLVRELYFSGNTVVIDHGQGLLSLLAHLSAFDIAEGDAVVAGQIIGRVGATGRVTGPHLHWAVHVTGARVDPLSVLALLGRDRP